MPLLSTLKHTKKKRDKKLVMTHETLRQNVAIFYRIVKYTSIWSRSAGRYPIIKGFFLGRCSNL